MRKFAAFMALGLLLASTSAFAGRGFPLTLGGFTLGENIQAYTSCCDLNLSSPMPDAPFLTEMHIKPDFLDGVRGGSLSYANCKEKGRLVRIKLKFHNRGQALFKDLLARYKTVFGEPDSYQGDTFRNVIAWQWVFEKDDQKVTLLLMWSRDNEIRPGVSIKMTLESLLDSECDCFRERMDRLEQKRGGPTKVKDLNDFIPK